MLKTTNNKNYNVYPLVDTSQRGRVINFFSFSRPSFKKVSVRVIDRFDGGVLHIDTSLMQKFNEDIFADKVLKQYKETLKLLGRE